MSFGDKAVPSLPENDTEEQNRDPGSIQRKMGINYQGSSTSNMPTDTPAHQPGIPESSQTGDNVKEPQRPEDLVNNVSFNANEVNLVSSAQYRKSYAFKIWRDKGFFPYRLAKDDVLPDGRQKSKKLLNALKIQRDRENEEAWRVFKSSKAKTIRAREKAWDKEKGQKQRRKPQVPRHIETDGKAVQHSIPNYFKTRKDSTSGKHNSQSIPTSVIHVTSPSKTDEKLQSSLQVAKPGKAGEYLMTGVACSMVHQTIASDNNYPVDLTGVASTTRMTTANNSGPIPSSGCDEPQKFNEQQFLIKPQVADPMITSDKSSMEHRAATDSRTASSHAGEIEEKNEGNRESGGNATPCAAELAAAIKNTLDKKYSKENVEPAGRRGALKRSRVNETISLNQAGRAKSRKQTVFTKLDETIATTLADGIHNVNSEYFPIGALANKAAKETKAIGTTVDGREDKVEEIGKARLLLKELFDVTVESDEDGEMRTFDAESRSFGRKNILNHLSLLDRYFAELQKKLSVETS